MSGFDRWFKGKYLPYLDHCARVNKSPLSCWDFYTCGSRNDRIMEAEDLFNDDINQMFSVRTGRFIGYRDTRENQPTEIEPEPEQIPEPAEAPEIINPQQLTLF